MLQESSFALYEMHQEQEVFEKYQKEGKVDEEKAYLEKDMQILLLLKNLGFPMDELGTYLYKDVIKEVCNNLYKEDINLVSSLKDCNSDFYRWIASDDKEIGLKSFHLYIGRAIDKINIKKAHKKEADIFYGDSFDYGIEALKIAAYISLQYKDKAGNNYDEPLIKKLSNFPENVRLKA